MIKHFRPFEGGVTMTCYLFVPQLPLTEPPDNRISMLKMAPDTVVLCGDRDLEVIHRCLAFMLLSHGYN